jgi:hypothetical protein
MKMDMQIKRVYESERKEDIAILAGFFVERGLKTAWIWRNTYLVKVGEECSKRGQTAGCLTSTMRQAEYFAILLKSQSAYRYHLAPAVICPFHAPYCRKFQELLL